MKRVRLALMVIALLMLGLVAVPLVRNSLAPRKQPRQENLPPPGVDMQLDNVHYEQINEEGRREWELNAQGAQYEQDKKQVALRSITVTFFSDEGNTYRLAADQGLLFTESRDVSLSGNVVAETAEGYQIRTESIQYNAREKKVSTADPVTFISKDMVMTTESRGSLTTCPRQPGCRRNEKILWGPAFTFCGMGVGIQTRRVEDHGEVGLKPGTPHLRRAS